VFSDVTIYCNMGNQKNKVNYRNRRHPYVKRNPNKWIKKRGAATLPSNPIESEKDDTVSAPDGSRIINLEKLAEFVNTFSQHVITCEKTTGLAENESKIQIEGETRRGLASVLSVKCKGCGKTLELESSKKVVGPKGIKRWECNLAAVWGQMATGGGHSRLSETMGILGVPTMSQKSFIETERELGEWWKQELEGSMKAAGEECQLAIERISSMKMCQQSLSSSMVVG